MKFIFEFNYILFFTFAKFVLGTFNGVKASETAKKPKHITKKANILSSCIDLFDIKLYVIVEKKYI